MYELSPDAQRIDSDFVRLSRYWSRFYYRTGNDYGFKLITEEADRLIEELSKLQPGTAFEYLWKENILQQLGVQAILARHFYSKPELPTIDIIEAACGPGAYQIIEDGFTKFDHRTFWEKLERDEERDELRVPTNTSAAQKLIEPYAPKIKEEILRTGIEQGYLPDDFTFEVDLSLPGTYSRAYWNPELGRFFLGYETFECFKEGGEIRVNPVSAYATAFHEMLGHASQQVNSENLPGSLRVTRRMAFNIPSRVILEGLAMQRELPAYIWLHENKERLGLNEQDIASAEQYFQINKGLAKIGVTLGILQERKKWEGLDLEKYLSALTDNPRKIWNFSEPVLSGFAGPNNQPYPFNIAIFELCYPAGFEAVEKTRKSFYGADEKKLNKALATGLWGWKTYPKAVEYFLKN
jgi:hypothetical protein